ncbi:NADH-quinone oxidoreductase subunit E [Rhodobacter capsulatus]|uniref:NADH-quinone oxidoreductase subunit E n=1 Tax=Rhodobacter capsulatus TaxID=1061 RepID=A0A1G7K0N8_RHOCA|nr:NADH-quinone oxidoreductase subunit E [Rhodobacter capsulatus]WER07940.1 NADH-quinone oxidoreductase subunit E [Rhodobacter capsulatus]SDF30672.1 NADH-quinone oxidoreductase subunit E [Rhodobacter capsulatus]
MLRRLHATQPESFAFTPANRAWAEAQITKYPEGRQASAVIPLLFRAQEQEGWLTKPAIEYVADLLDMPYIRVLEVASFYFMFQLQPTGSVAHIQVCGTTSCMIMGSENLISVCKRKISHHPHALSADGKFSWEEVECLGACANAPMAQIGKDYYEDLTEAGLERLIDDLAAGKTLVPGSEIGRFGAEPATGLTSCTATPGAREAQNGSVARAVAVGDGTRRIDGTEVRLSAPWQVSGQMGAIGLMNARPRSAVQQQAAAEAAKAAATPDLAGGTSTPAAQGAGAAAKAAQTAETAAQKPLALAAARDGKADDLQKIESIGPALEALLHDLGIFHFDQIAAWGVAEIAWMDGNLKGFPGRASGDRWVVQAKIIVEEGLDRFLERAKTNNY